MNCPACQHENRDGAKFCEECAAPLRRACASCRAELRPTAKFCDECGAPVPGAASARPAAAPAPVDADGSRKVVSIIFADLAGSTALHERLDAESARVFMERYYTAMRSAVEAHGGRVAKLLGDGVMATFGLPLVAEDDAIRAVRAAVAMQEAFRELASRHSALVGAVGLRVAVNTGEVVAKGETELIGDPVNVAARLQDKGSLGDVVIGESTRRLVADLVTLDSLGSLALKGRSEAVTAYRVVSLERPASATTAAFVGREQELSRLAAAYRSAADTPATRLAVLLGSPGLGKSRLVAEFLRRLDGEAVVVTAHCDAAGGATFAPLARALREHLAIDDGATDEAVRTAIGNALPPASADDGRIADGIAALLAASPASPEETFFVIRRFLGAMASVRPLVLVVDDVHWASPLLLDLVEHLVQWGAGVPVFVLIGARPELRDTRSSLVVPGALVADVLTLGGLDAGAAMRLAANMIGAADLPSAVAARVLATSEGNPLFVGELVRMLVHEGALKRDGDRWTIGAGLAALQMPPTIHALLAARIERLRPEDRLVLERAAVVGRHFSRSAVAELLPREDGDLDARLESLRRSELIEPDTGWFLGEPALRFHHVLIRDAAYRRLLKNTRAELHERLADWIRGRAGDAVEHDETIGWHLEQAWQHLRELGPLDDAGRALGERASRHLAAAGRRALARDDLPLAADLLGRALDVLVPGDASRAELALDWCEALLAAGNVVAASKAIDELDGFAAASPRLRAWHTCFVGQRVALTSPRDLQATADAVEAAAAEFSRLGDAAGEAKAHSVHAQALARLGQVGDCEAALDKALAAARRVGDRRRANAVLAGAPQAALWGPSPVTRASGRCLDVVRVLRITQGAPAVEAAALSCQGVLEALRGRTDAARRMTAAARKMVEELGITHRLLETDVAAGRIDLLEGNATAAEPLLRSAYEGLRDLGLGSDAAQAAALLARALLAQGRGEEAEALSFQSEALAGDDLQAAIAWRGVRAEALALRGEHAPAIELARAAVAIASETDALLDHADARLALAAALRSAGRPGEAAAEEHRARELWEAKGAVLLAGRGLAGTSGEAAATATQPPQPSIPDHRPALHNAATRNFDALSHAVLARDVDAVTALFTEDSEIVHHPTGMRYDRETLRASWPQLFAVENLHYHHEPLAVLGNRLALARRVIRSDGFDALGTLSFGPLEVENILVGEVGEDGRRTRTEIFTPAHLADATSRLYEFYADSLADEAAKRHAMRAARSVRDMRNSQHLDVFASAFVDEIDVIDHRIAGFGTLKGTSALLGAATAFMDQVEESAWTDDDILGCTPDAILTLATNHGHDRDGDAFERRILSLVTFGREGLIDRFEIFDGERRADAAARFAELTGTAPSVAAPARPPRPNHATAIVDAVLSAFERDDLAAIEAILDKAAFHELDHATGSSDGYEGLLDSLRGLRRSQAPWLRIVPLATLGEGLALGRRQAGARGTGGSRDDAGESGNDALAIVQAGSDGLFAGQEVFAADRLGDAIARLYDLHAATLPEGPARERAERIALGVAMSVTPLVVDDLATVVSPDVEFVDRRTLVGGRLRGLEDTANNFRTWAELSDDSRYRVDEILRLEPDALLRVSTHFGTGRASGGAFEIRSCVLTVWGADGRIVRQENFDADRRAEALARFDELVAPQHPRAAGNLGKASRVRRVQPNRATRNVERQTAAVAAGDLDTLAAMLAPAMTLVDHPNGANYGPDGALSSMRRFLRSDGPAMRFEALGTLGPSLGLFRRWSGARAAVGPRFDVGEYDREELYLLCMDERDLIVHAEIWGPDRLGEALLAMLTLHAQSLPEGPGRQRAQATARCLADALSTVEHDDPSTLFAPDFVAVDHRPLVGHESVEFEDFRRGNSAWREATETIRFRIDDVLALRSDVIFRQSSMIGTLRAGGGSVARTTLALSVFAADGRSCRNELFDLNQEDLAWARFDELTSGGAASVDSRFENEASRALRSWRERWETADWEDYSRDMHPDFRLFDRRRLARVELSRDETLDYTRHFAGMTSAHFRPPVLVATRGERLCLVRFRFDLEDGDVGPSLVEFLSIVETSESGQGLAIVHYDIEDLDAAMVELQARYDNGERAGNVDPIGRFEVAYAARDWEAIIAMSNPGMVERDLRPLAVLDTSHGPEAWIQSFKNLAEMASDTRWFTTHARRSGKAWMAVGGWRGTQEGGEFEIPFVVVSRLDDQDRFELVELRDLDQLVEALARYEEIRRECDAPGTGSVVGSPAQSADSTLAVRVLAPLIDRFRLQDWEAVRAMVRDDFVYEDRGRRALVTGDVETWLESLRFITGLPGVLFERETVAVHGERLVLSRISWKGSSDAIGFETEKIHLAEVDEGGRVKAVLLFDLEDRDAAFEESLSRLADHEVRTTATSR